MVGTIRHEIDTIIADQPEPRWNFGPIDILGPGVRPSGCSSFKELRIKELLATRQT